MARSGSHQFAVVAVAVAALFLLFVASSVKGEEVTEVEKEVEVEVEMEVDYVVALDHSNFTEYVYKQDFIVVEFYAPWCGACRGFEPEFKAAAKELNSHDPPIILAKIDASAEENSAVREKYKIEGYPTVKTFRKQGKHIEEYYGNRQTAGLVSYFKKLVGPPSIEIKSAEHAAKLINDQPTIFIVGLFPSFSGEEYNNFTNLAEKLRTRFDFAHTSNAEFLPRREKFNKPTLRIFKPFDDIFVDSKNFADNAMRRFIQDASTPFLTMFDGEDINEKYVDSFFNNKKAKVMLFINFTKEYDAFKPIYYDLARSYKKAVSFMLGDTDVSHTAFKYFALKKDDAPLILVYGQDGTKYLKTNVAPNDIAPWLIDYKNGKLEEYIRSEPIPEVNDKPVKVVVLETLQKMVLESEKDVLLDLYESVGCGLCKRLAPILDEVAISFENDTDILIAKFDTNANDITTDMFDVQDFPTMYLITSTGKKILYEGSKRYTKEDIIEFIEKNRETPSKTTDSIIPKVDTENPDIVKEEL